MTRMVASVNWLSKARGWSLTFVAIMLLLGAAIVTGPLHVFAAPAASNAQVTVNAGQSLGALTSVSKGINTAVWDGDMLDSPSLTAIKNAGIQTLRYPGGSTSDVYHWQSNTVAGGFASPGNNFDAFMNGVQSIGAQPVITVDYGSGTAQEAAGWVQYANKGGAGYNGPVPTYTGGSSTGHNYGIKYWEIGNEIYGNGTYGASWETDSNTHSPATYANNVIAYSRAMKAVDATIKVGAVVTAPGNWPDGITNSASPQPWNTTVLSTACSSIDYIIPHWYPQNPGSESDAGLLGDTSQIAGMVSTLRSEINQYCGAHASAVQILVTETNSVSSNPGKQTVSTVNVLFQADDYMSWLENGVANVDWWTLHNNAVAGNTSSSLFGNAQYGDYGILSNGTCTSTTSNICEPAVDTPFPAYYGLLMLNKLGTAGDTMVSSSSNQALVSVHAVKQASGDLAVLLINKDPNNSYNVSLALNGYTPATNATVYTYGENSSAIATAQVTGLTSPVTQQVAPYSLTIVVLHPGSSVPTPTPAPTHTPTPTPTSTPAPTPVPTHTPTPSGTCQVHYSANQWPGGFTASLTITNTGTTALNSWNLTFAFPGSQQVTQGWNGIFSQQGANVTVTNASYNASLPAGSSVNPGFNGSWSGSNPSPTAFNLNGTSCSVV